MFEELLQWFAPGHREVFSKVFTDLVARVEALEAKLGVGEQAAAAPAQAPAASTQTADASAQAAAAPAAKS